MRRRSGHGGRAALALAAGLLLAGPPARAAGYRLVRTGVLAGPGEAEGDRVGFELSPVSDGLVLGAEIDAGGSVRRWGLDSARFGPVLGLPPSEVDDGGGGRDWWTAWARGRVGGDADLGRRLDLEWARLGLLSIPGFWGADPRLFHFGPAVGPGLGVTWWAPGEVGWLLGADWRDRAWVQGHVLGRMDLFGEHRAGVAARGVAGLFFGRRLPLGLELRGEVDRGEDRFTGEATRNWSARAVLFYQATFPEPGADDLDAFERFLAEMEAAEAGSMSEAEVEAAAERLHRLLAEEAGEAPAGEGTEAPPAAEGDAAPSAEGEAAPPEEASEAAPAVEGAAVPPEEASGAAPAAEGDAVPPEEASEAGAGSAPEEAAEPGGEAGEAPAAGDADAPPASDEPPASGEGEHRRVRLGPEL